MYSLTKEQKLANLIETYQLKLQKKQNLEKELQKLERKIQKIQSFSQISQNFDHRSEQITQNPESRASQSLTRMKL